MKHFLCVAIFLLSLATRGIGQKTEQPLETQIKFDLALQGFGISIEHPLNTKSSIECSVGGGGGYEIANGELGYKYRRNYPAFFLSVNPRYYYNRNRLLEKGASQALNAGNYFGFKTKLNSAILEHYDISSPALLTNIHWGMQRAISGNFQIDFKVGLGYAHNLSSFFGTMYPTLDLKLSYVFLNGNDWKQ